MILQFQIERKNKIENSSRTAWGGKKGKYSVRHLRFQSSLFNVALEMASLIFATFSLAKA